MAENDAAVREMLRPVSLGLGSLYAFFAFVHVLVLPPTVAVVLSPAAAATAALLYALAALGPRVPTRLAHPVAAGVAGLVLLHSSLLLFLLADPVQTTNLLLLVVGAGFLLLSWRWLALVLAATVGTFLAAVPAIGPSPYWLHFGFALVSAVVLSILVHQVRLASAERVRAAIREAHASEARGRSLADAAFEGLLFHEGGVILESNRAFAEMLGRTPESLVGVTCFDFFAPESHDLIRSRLTHLRDDVYEAVLLRTDGERLHAEIHGRVGWWNGRRVRVVAVRDITERQKAEAVWRLALAHQTEAEKLREVDRLRTEFFNSAAHELGTPLTTARIQLHLLEEAGPLAARQRKALTVLGRNVARLTTLARDILDSARVSSGRLATRRVLVRLDELVRASAEAFEASAGEAGLAFDVVASEPLLVDADPQRVGQVLDNLLANALRFTPAGGRVRLVCAARDGVAEIRVADTGIGLAPEGFPKLFQPFSQVHDAGAVRDGGTGLGLYISKGIVEQHGGTIEAQSEGAGKGSTFVVRLPLATVTVRPRAAGRTEGPTSRP